MAMQPGAPGGLGLGADDRVGLAVVGAALGVADDDRARAGVRQHLGRDVAGVGARGGAWQSCPPTGSGAAGAPAHRAISVAGGQISTSAGLPRPARGDRADLVEAAARPFIFQLPAIRWRISLEAPRRAAAGSSNKLGSAEWGSYVLRPRAASRPGLLLSARLLHARPVASRCPGLGLEGADGPARPSFAIWGISASSGLRRGHARDRRECRGSDREVRRRHQQLQNAAQQSGRQVSPEQVLDRCSPTPRSRTRR